MGKSNILDNKSNKFYQRENNLNNFLNENEIEKLENVNDYFVKEIKIKLSNFFKQEVKKISFNMGIESFCKDKKKKLEYFKYFNLIEILSYDNPFFIFFSSDFFSVIIDMLFGGNTNNTDHINKIIYNTTSSELYINKKLVNFIISSLSDAFKNCFYSKKISVINIKTVVDLNKIFFNSHELFLVNTCNFKINNKNIYFSILFPFSIIKKINQKLIFSIEKNKNLHLSKNISNEVFFEDICDIELDIVSRIIDISISYNEFNALSVGDILTIKKPDKIIGLIENKAVFFGDYKIFNKQSIVFIKKFIDSDVKYNKYKEFYNE